MIKSTKEKLPRTRELQSSVISVLARGVTEQIIKVVTADTSTPCAAHRFYFRLETIS